MPAGLAERLTANEPSHQIGSDRHGEKGDREVYDRWMDFLRADRHGNTSG
jgi:hypothetical protein